MKKETIEEVDNKWSLEEAQKFALSKFKKEGSSKKGFITQEVILEVLKVGVLTGHKFGAKYQAERMYSEEEVFMLLRKAHFVEQNIEEWFEENKKENKNTNDISCIVCGEIRNQRRGNTCKEITCPEQFKKK